MRMDSIKNYNVFTEKLYCIALDLDGITYTGDEKTDREIYGHKYDFYKLIYDENGMDNSTSCAFNYYVKNGSVAGEKIPNLFDYDVSNIPSLIKDICVKLTTLNLELCIIFNTQNLYQNETIRKSLYLTFFKELVKNGVKNVTVVCPKNTFSDLESIIESNGNILSVSFIPIDLLDYTR